MALVQGILTGGDVAGFLFLYICPKDFWRPRPSFPRYENNHCNCWSWKLKFISFDFLKFHQCEVFTSESSTANNIKANLGRAFCCCSNKLMKQYFCRFWRLRPSAALPLLALTSSNFSAINGDAVRIAMHCQTQQYNNKALPTRLHSTI